MNELYLIRLIGMIHEFAVAFFIISIVVLIYKGIMYAVVNADSVDIYKELNDFQKERIKTKLHNFYKGFIPLICAMIALAIFPTEESALKIYGFGSVIDYMQSSEEAKKLPDNALKAINIWLEDFQENDAKRK